jgi:hypothetical protein
MVIDVASKVGLAVAVIQVMLSLDDSQLLLLFQFPETRDRK